MNCFKSLKFVAAAALMTLSSAVFAGTINVNQASAEVLDELHGIGPSKATAIVEYRKANGQFKQLDDLLEVPGIGKATLKKIEKDISLTAGAVATTDKAKVTDSKKAKAVEKK